MARATPRRPTPARGPPPLRAVGVVGAVGAVGVAHVADGGVTIQDDAAAVVPPHTYSAQHYRARRCRRRPTPRRPRPPRCPR